MIEIWKPIRNYENRYLVSNLGNIKSLRRNKILVPIIQSNNYCYINLCVNGKNKSCRIHRLVAEAFIPNPNNLPCVNHKDGNKQNNNVDNLEWCTNKYNSQHAYKNNMVQKTIRTVIQYDLYGNFIAEYNSHNEASKNTNIPRVEITKSANGNKNITKKYGFIFKNKYPKYDKRNYVK